MSNVISIKSLPVDIIGIIVLLTYDGQHIPAMLLTCRAWAALPKWIRIEMRFKRCMRIYGGSPWLLAVNYEWLDALPLLHEREVPGCNKHVMDQAAKKGFLRILSWLSQNRTEGCSEEALNSAAANGHLQTVIWLHENRTEGCTTDAVDWAAINGHISVVTWLLEHRREGFTSVALQGAARRPKVVAVLQKHQHLLKKL